MPKIPAVVTAIADAFGFERSAVYYTVRHMRETNELVPTTKRGRAASDLTVPEVGKLAVGVLSGVPAREAANAALEYWNGGADGTWGLAALPIASLQKLGPAHTFGDAFTALIEAAADNSLDTALRSMPRQVIDGNSIPNLFHFEIRMFWPLPAATIEFHAHSVRESVTYQGPLPDLAHLQTWAEDQKKRHPSDFKQVRMIGLRAIRILGRLFSDTS